MHVRIINGVASRYIPTDLLKEHPNVSFPSKLSESFLAQYEIYLFKQTEPPLYNFVTHTVTEYFEKEDDQWVQKWTVTELPIDESDALKEQYRLNAYRVESDPLFFKAQRGEATQQEWLDKVAEIKARYS
jgi:hypothetical protein